MREDQKQILACAAAGAAAGFATFQLYRLYLSASIPGILPADTTPEATATRIPPKTSKAESSSRAQSASKPPPPSKPAEKPSPPPKPVEGAAVVSVLGTGWGVKVQTPAFKQAGIRLGGIYSRDQKRADELAKTHEFARGYSDYAKLIDDDKVDLVSIVTPTGFHCDQAIDALNAGRSVLCEKPMALNAGEAEKMMAAARAHPMQVAIMDHELRFTPMLQTARSHLQKGTIGTVRWVEVKGIIPEAMTSGGWTWWADREAGGGAWGALGSHVIDALRFLFHGEVEHVSANLRSVTPTLKDKASGKDKPVTADDYASVHLALVPSHVEKTNDKIWGGGPDAPQRVEVHMTLAMAGVAPHASEMVIAGTKGAITLDINTSSTRILDAKQQVIDEVKGEGNAFAATGSRLLAQAIARAFGPEKDRSALDCAAKFEDGVAVQYVLDAAWESSDNGGAKTEPKKAAVNYAGAVKDL